MFIRLLPSARFHVKTLTRGVVYLMTTCVIIEMSRDFIFQVHRKISRILLYREPFENKLFNSNKVCVNHRP